MQNVIPLFDSHRARLIELREWFSEQSAVPTVAAVSVCLTDDGIIRTMGCGIEPENARFLLERLDGLRYRLEKIASGDVSIAPAVRQQCQVIPIRRDIRAQR